MSFIKYDDHKINNKSYGIMEERKDVTHWISDKKYLYYIYNIRWYIFKKLFNCLFIILLFVFLFDHSFFSTPSNWFLGVLNLRGLIFIYSWTWASVMVFLLA